MQYKLYNLDIDTDYLYQQMIQNEEKIRFNALDSAETGYDAAHKLKKTACRNTFMSFSTDYEWYRLFSSVTHCVNDYIKDNKLNTDKGLWLRSWPLVLSGEIEVPSHRHNWKIFGYVCLDSKQQDTIFTDGEYGRELYRIHNKPGQLYLGPCEVYHHVEKFYTDEPRITIGFDITDSLHLDTKELNFIPMHVNT